MRAHVPPERRERAGKSAPVSNSNNLGRYYHFDFNPQPLVAGWRERGRSMLQRYRVTGKAVHLTAFHRNAGAIGGRIRAWRAKGLV